MGQKQDNTCCSLDKCFCQVNKLHSQCEALSYKINWGTLEKKPHIELWPPHVHETLFMQVLKHVYMYKLTPVHTKNIQHGKVILANE